LCNLPHPGRTLAVLIDALDEATKDGKNELALFLATEFERVPAWLRLIVTSRPIPELLAAFYGQQPFDLGAHAEEGRRDLAGFLRQELMARSSSPAIELTDELVDRLAAQSDGNFLYAEAVRRELAEGHVAPNQISGLPRGLAGVYSDFFRRQFSDLADYKRRVRPFLEIVTAVQGEPT
jgi:hypothetical protein